MTSPTSAEFRDAFERVIHDSLTVLSIPKSVLQAEDLSAYVMAEGDEGDDVQRELVGVQDMIQGDERFEQLTSEIYSSIDQAFGQVRGYIKVFDPYLKTAKENDVFVDDIKERLSSASLETTRSEIDRYKGMTTAFGDNLAASAVVGIIRLDSARLAEKLMPTPSTPPPWRASWPPGQTPALRRSPRW